MIVSAIAFWVPMASIVMIDWRQLEFPADDN
jgi:hypothetical protein